jgi:hypothetical protein
VASPLAPGARSCHASNVFMRERTLRGLQLAWLPALALSALLAGCGGSSHSAATTKPYVVALPGLGTITDTCASGHLVRAAFNAAEAPATETVSVEGDDGQHLRAGTMNPGSDTLAAPPAVYHQLTWRVVQSTEPHTIVETVAQQFDGCAVTSSTPRVRVISHAGQWTPPSEWA